MFEGYIINSMYSTKPLLYLDQNKLYIRYVKSL